MAMLSDWGLFAARLHILEGTELHQKLDFVTKGLSVRGMVEAQPLLRRRHQGQSATVRLRTGMSATRRK